jgi:uncharacterized protein (DUF2252 family)
MMVSPFTFYRGAATIMAADLSQTPVAGLDAQLCGDAHLSNFGAFASPERTLLFDLNDFDETLPGPFEYDVKRMAASFTIAGRNNGFSEADTQAATLASVAGYREAMADFAQMRTMDIWYAHLDENELMSSIRETVASMAKGAKGKKGKKAAKKAVQAGKRAEKNTAKAHSRDSLQALSKLGEVVDGRYRIASQPPVVIPARDMAATFGLSGGQLSRVIRDQFRAYRATLPDDRRRLLERFQVVDMARKVVGVGSVGTRAWVLLLLGRDTGDPLFIQAKEAQPSVLEPFAGKSEFGNQGRRVVEGQRLMQAASDIFLGWLRTTGLDEERRDFYLRQLWDWKTSADIETMPASGMVLYGRLCGWTLARAHARSGDAIAIAAYLGTGDVFDRAIVSFAEAYADQNELDHRALNAAIDEGRLPCEPGI